eukprot:62956-Chlamydomonas_euryale.AAC.4
MRRTGARVEREGRWFVGVWGRSGVEQDIVGRQGKCEARQEGRAELGGRGELLVLVSWRWARAGRGGAGWRKRFLVGLHVEPHMQNSALCGPRPHFSHCSLVEAPLAPHTCSCPPHARGSLPLHRLDATLV